MDRAGLLPLGEIEIGVVKTTLVPGLDRASGQSTARFMINRTAGAFILQECAPLHDPMVNCAGALHAPVVFIG